MRVGTLRPDVFSGTAARPLLSARQGAQAGPSRSTTMRSLSEATRSKYWVDGFPELVKQWDGPANGDLSPTNVSAGSGRLVWWTCPVSPDHRWRAKPNNRTRGSGCPFCANRRVSVTNSLAALLPELAGEWLSERNGAITPEAIVATATRRVWWQCRHDRLHVWRASVRDRARDLALCPFCSNHRVCASNSLLANHPGIAAEWHPTRNGALAAHDVTPGSAKRVWWRCGVCDRAWLTSVANRVSRASGCPACANRTRAERIASRKLGGDP
jgi:hypothetical protein